MIDWEELVSDLNISGYTLLTWERQQLSGHLARHGARRRRVTGRRRGHAIGITVLRVRGRGVRSCRLQHRGLLVIRVVRHGASGCGLRSVWLSRGQMGMDVHVGLTLVHAAERGRAGIIALLGDAVLRIQ